MKFFRLCLFSIQFFNWGEKWGYRSHKGDLGEWMCFCSFIEMYLISFIHSYFPLLAPFQDIATVHFANFWKKKNQLFPRRRAQSDGSCESASAQSGKPQSSVLFTRQPRLTLEKLRWSLETVAPQPQSLTFRRPAKLLFFANTHPADIAPSDKCVCSSCGQAADKTHVRESESSVQVHLPLIFSVRPSFRRRWIIWLFFPLAECFAVSNSCSPTLFVFTRAEPF